MKKLVIVSVLVCAVAIGGLIYWTTQKHPSSYDERILAQQTTVTADWTKGNPNAKVILVEYSDFECPACASYWPLTKRLADEFGNQIGFVYKHFPLWQIHKNAQAAAWAAEAAGRQDKFWQMHDLLFENQDQWAKQKDAKEIFAEYAKSLNLDAEKFKKDMGSKEVKEKVDGDHLSGVRLNVNATPTFFINGEKITNPPSYEQFRDLIKHALGE